MSALLNIARRPTDLSQVAMKWNYPTTVHFGNGKRRELPSLCASLGVAAPLLITDAGLAALPVIQETLALCREGGLKVGLFSSIQPNPVEENVTAGVAAYRAGGHDGVIAMGGGSALDAAKAIALMVGQTRPLWDFEDVADWYTRVNVAGMAPVIAVPTTAGTGSEVGRASVITDVRDHTKKIIFHPKMLPALVVLDPEVTVGLPAHLTAAVGMDALSHNLEALCSPYFHPMAHGIAVEGVRMIQRALIPAFDDGRDLNARGEMLVASSMGATAFQKGLGAMHSMSHPCGAVLNTQHGLTNAVVMPYVLMFNRAQVSDKLTDLARAMDLPAPSFDTFLRWVLDMRERLAIPHTLRALGVAEEHVATLATQAVADPSTGSNPRPLTQEAAEGLFARALSGDLSEG